MSSVQPAGVLSSHSSGTSNTVLSGQKHPVAPPEGRLNEAADGKSSRSSETAVASTDDDYYKVTTLDTKNDPQRFHIGRKWLITLLICNGSLCATFASSVVRVLKQTLVVSQIEPPSQSAATEPGLQRTFHTIHEVTVLSLSLYVVGFGECERT